MTRGSPPGQKKRAPELAATCPFCAGIRGDCHVCAGTRTVHWLDLPEIMGAVNVARPGCRCDACAELPRPDSVNRKRRQ